MKLTIGGKDVDLSRAFPVTLGDLRALTRDGVLNKKGELDAGPEEIAKMILHFTHKVNAAVTEDDINNLDMKSLTAVAEAIKTEIGREDQPSPSS